MVSDAINELLGACDEHGTLRFASDWFKRTKTHSPKDPRIQSLWNSLAADSIQDKDWWAAYVVLVDRRHAVVHHGAEPTRDEAEQSLKAADSFRAHVDAKLQQARRGDDS
jgi:hypothetical protein